MQHLLYAVIKPLYPDIRKEVTEDSGAGAIRSDIRIPSLNTIIEAKCTRKTIHTRNWWKKWKQILFVIIAHSCIFMFMIRKRL